MKTLTVYYEHPEWFRPLFRELDRRGLPYRELNAREHRFDPDRSPRHELVLNRMSPSAHLRGSGRVVPYTLAWLEHLERHGVRVINGLRAFRTEISKARQISLLGELGLAHPASRVIHDARQAPEAARGLRYPVVVKANVGGSGAGITRFDDPDALRAAVQEGLDLGPDGTGLVQEFVPARGGHITRVEVLDGRFLYAIRVHLGDGERESFDLCPADLCPAEDGEAAEGGDVTGEGRATKVPGAGGPRVEGCRPPEEAVEGVERVAAAAGVEVGGVEYLVDDRDGEIRFYDVNALSNFVADAPRVVGFDPWEEMVDWLEREASTVAGVRP